MKIVVKTQLEYSRHVKLLDYVLHHLGIAGTDALIGGNIVHL